MKYLFFSLLFFIVACQGENTAVVIPKKPSPKRFYNDFTGSKFLSVEQASSIESKLVKFNKETSNEIVADLIVLHKVFEYYVSSWSLKSQGCKAAGSNQHQKQAQISKLDHILS